MDDFDDPARAAEARRARRGPADGLSTAERLARLRDGLSKGVQPKGGEARRLASPDSLRRVRAVTAPDLDKDVYGAAGRAEPTKGAAKTDPKKTAPAADDPSLVRSMLREMRKPGPAAPTAPGDGKFDDSMTDPVTGGAILRAGAAHGAEPHEPGGRLVREPRRRDVWSDQDDDAFAREPRDRLFEESPAREGRGERRGPAPRETEARRARGPQAEEDAWLEGGGDNWGAEESYGREEFGRDLEPRRAERRGPRRPRAEPKTEARPSEPRRASKKPQKSSAPRRTAPFGALERLLAGRYLGARREEGFISVIAILSLVGIALGVATLIIVMAVMNGFRTELVEKIVGVNGHLNVTSLSGRLENYDDLAQRIQSVPGVTRAAPMIEGQAFASTSRAGAGVYVRGVRHDDLMTLEHVAVTPESSIGSLAEYSPDSDGIAIGSRLARILGVTVGDRVTLLSPRGSVTPFGVTPRRKAYEVQYIFKVGMARYDEAVVFMPLAEAQRFFNKPDRVDQIEVMVATPEHLAGYREDIEAVAQEPLYIGDWQQSNGSLMGALKTERTVMFLILTLLIVIASMIIISGLIMLVKEKRSNIAILRTMGLSRGAVMRVFFMCGAAIGLMGTIIGVSLGVLFCYNIGTIQSWVEYLANGEVFAEDIYLLSRLPARLLWSDVGLTVGVTLGLSFLATLYPAWRAARLDPVEALRYE